MGMPGGTTEEIRRAADAAAAESLTTLTAMRRAENVSAAAVVHAVHDLTELRFGTEYDIYELGHDEPDLAFARRAVECEAAVALSLSKTVTRDMITVGAQLAWRLPSIDAAFTKGDIDYPRTRTIALTLAKASDQTVSDLEADILAAALRMNTRGLREKIWKAWFAYDHDEATAAQKAVESEERCADVRRGDDGTATLISKMSILEGAECNAVLDELAGTVCDKDPRTKKQLRGFALLSLVHREDYIACTCGLADCKVKGIADEQADRRKPLIQILMDVETLLGLTNEPATLSDGTVLDPAIARHIAEDAQWQVMLTDTLDAARARLRHDDAHQGAGRATSSTGTSSNESPSGTEGSAGSDKTTEASAKDDRSTGDDAGRPAGRSGAGRSGAGRSGEGRSGEGRSSQDSDPDGDRSDDGPSDDTECGGLDDEAPECGGSDGGTTGNTTQPRVGPQGGPRARTLLHRGRVRPAAPLPPAPSEPPEPPEPPSTESTGSNISGHDSSGHDSSGQGSSGQGAPPSGGSARSSGTGEESTLSACIADFLAAAASDPSLTQGPYPDGHGGYTTPPAGALTYRPTAELVALTRATHCVCTFPGCSVPAARCEIDHIVPFDHSNPSAGGWTILSNLHPLCKFHHQAKTLKLWAAAKLHGDSIYWVSTSGLHRITPSTYGTVMVPEDFLHTSAAGKTPREPWPGDDFVVNLDERAEDQQPAEKKGLERRPSDALYEPTWWETNIGEDDSNWFRIANIANPVANGTMRIPTLGDIARMTDPRDREDAKFIRRKFLEHREVIAARENRNYRAPF